MRTVPQAWRPVHPKKLSSLGRRKVAGTLRVPAASQSSKPGLLKKRGFWFEHFWFEQRSLRNAFDRRR